MSRLALALALLVAPALAAPALAEGAATVAAAESPALGAYLADGSGRTLYMFESDRQGMGGTAPSSSCGGDCAAAWPPLLTDGPPVAGDGVDAAKLGTLDRGDGTTQVTYAGWPLYAFVRDAAPGDVAGQGASGFGGGWYVLTPEGRVDRKAP